MTRLRRILVLTTARLALPAIIGLSLASSSAQAQIGVLAPAGTANPMAATQTSIQGIFTDVQNTGTLFRSGATQMAGGGQSMGGGMGLFHHQPAATSGFRTGAGQMMTGGGQFLGATGQVAALPFKFMSLVPQMMLAIPGQAMTTAGQAIQGVPAAPAYAAPTYAAPTVAVAAPAGVAPGTVTPVQGGGIFHRNIVARGPKYTVTEPRQSLLSRFHHH